MAWLIIKSDSKNFNFQTITHNRVLVNKGFTVIENFDKRFSADKILYSEHENQVFLLDGVVLNKTELYSDFESNNMLALLKKLIEKQNTPFCTELRGPFTGCWCDVVNDTMYAFGNQTGDAAVFYYHDKDYFVVSSDFNMVYDFCKLNRIPITFNEIAANHILSLGYVVDGNTFVKEICRVKPGEIVSFYNNEIKEKVYHRFNNDELQNISLSESVEMLDIAFRKAVKRCFNKDIEYGYENHIADISGGLDSRMTCWVAKEMGYSNITNISYSKYNSDESKFAFIASAAMNNELIFKPLDDLHFFFDIEENIKKNYGLSIYNGITGGKRLLSDLNFEKYGLEHTGMLGDVVVGSFCSKPDDFEINSKNICYSDIINADINNYSQYENFEIFALYYRGFQGALTSHFIRRNYTETVSPFIDVDFLQLCLSLPLTFRCGHKLYWEWILTKYPDIAKIPSTRSFPNKKNISIRTIGLKIIGNKKRYVLSILKRLRLYKLMQNPNDMNPLNYWYYTNPRIQDFMNNYYLQHIDLIKSYPITQQNVEQLFHGDKSFDKSLAMTVLGSYSVYFK